MKIAELMEQVGTMREPRDYIDEPIVPAFNMYVFEGDECIYQIRRAYYRTARAHTHYRILDRDVSGYTYIDRIRTLIIDVKSC